MALSSLRLRQSLSTFSTLHRSLAAAPAISAPSSSSSPLFHDTACVQYPAQSRALLFQFRMFRSSSISLMSAQPSDNSKDDEIGPEPSDNSKKDEIGPEPSDNSKDDEIGPEPSDNSKKDEIGPEPSVNSKDDEIGPEPSDNSKKDEVGPEPSDNSKTDEIGPEPSDNSKKDEIGPEPSDNSKKEEIGPDTILFEGCDDNHWLFVMDFPKDPKPSPEEMVRTYEETCAKGLNISVEEAKLKIYACSTTIYTGFHAVMTEEESEKFNDLPGVIFVLPDCYDDPKKKEYGGDKYINGTIIPRPPPVQSGRQTGKSNDRNRFSGQPRYDRQGQQGKPSYGNQQGKPSYGNQQGNPSYGNQRGNPSFGNQSPTQGGGRNYGNPQNYPPQQKYGPPGQGERRDPMPMNAPQGRDPMPMNAPQGRDPLPLNASQGRDPYQSTDSCNRVPNSKENL